MQNLHKTLLREFPDYSPGDWKIFGDSVTGEESIGEWNRPELQPSLSELETMVATHANAIATERAAIEAKIIKSKNKEKKHNQLLEACARLILGQAVTQDDIDAATEYLTE